MVKLWHDDVRPPPDDSWEWAKTNVEAVEILQDNHVTLASLDHDLGAEGGGIYARGISPDGSGYDLVMWITQNMHYAPEEVVVHSWNIYRAKVMGAELLAVGIPTRLEPFSVD